VKVRWSQPPVNVAWFPKRDRLLEGAVDQELPPRACGRTQHWVYGFAVTDRRWSGASASRLQMEAASSGTLHRGIS
jgi:hypothetical protein